MEQYEKGHSRHRGHRRERRPRSRAAGILLNGLYYILGLALTVAVLTFLMKTKQYYVPSPSMEPTLRVGERFRVDLLTSPQRDPQRGEIWVFYHPRPSMGGEEEMVKRVIGLPGETVAVKNGKVLINGKPLAEPYVAEPIAYRMKPRKLGPSEHWMLGDNRNDSEDSSQWGPLARRNFIGRAFLRYKPLGLDRLAWL
jgi:signal peptidase I